MWTGGGWFSSSSSSNLGSVDKAEAGKDSGVHSLNQVRHVSSRIRGRSVGVQGGF